MPARRVSWLALVVLLFTVRLGLAAPPIASLVPDREPARIEQVHAAHDEPSLGVPGGREVLQQADAGRADDGGPLWGWAYPVKGAVAERIDLSRAGPPRSRERVTPRTARGPPGAMVSRPSQA